MLHEPAASEERNVIRNWISILFIKCVRLVYVGCRTSLEAAVLGRRTRLISVVTAVPILAVYVVFVSRRRIRLQAKG